MAKSKSQSTVSTVTEQYDQRAVAEQGSIAIGGGSQVTYAPEFGDNVAAAFESLVDFAGEAGAVAIKQVGVTQAVMAAELERKQTLVPTAVTQTLPYMAIGLIVVAIFMVLKKGR